MDKVKRHAKRVSIAVVGTLVVLVGIVAIPYPGPGWLIVFAGLAILATEFDWAQRLLDKARSYYDAWVDWLKRRHWSLRLIVLAFTGIVIMVTIWLLNGFGVVNHFLRLDWNLLNSPLSISH